MADILDESLWTSESWGTAPPVYDTLTVDGVEVTAVVIDNGELFLDSAWRNGYEEGNVKVLFEDKGGEIILEFWPYGDSSDTHHLRMDVFDENGSQLDEFYSDTCGYEGGCQTWVGFDYDFSGSTNSITPNDWTVNEISTSGGQFSGDRLLLAFGTGGVAPDNWPEAIQSDTSYSVSTTSGVSASYCGGDTVEVSMEFQSRVLIGSADVAVSVTNPISGNTSQQTITASQSGTTQTFSVTVPEGAIGSSLDVIEISVNGNVEYTGTANVGPSDDQIQFGSVELPSEIVGGRGYEGSIDVSNESNCSAEITTSYTVQ